jgi:hypothetical protein
MPGKDPATYDTDEVCIWIMAIGLGSKVDAFRENAVDGDMLLSLTAEDFVDPLGLTSLQAKKIQRSLDFTKQLANESSGGGGGGEEAANKIKALEEINEYLKNENAALKMQLQEFQNANAPPPKPAPAPAPKPAPAPAPQRKEHHVIKGAAGGAAKGALLGAIGGAIAGDAGKGAKVRVMKQFDFASISFRLASSHYFVRAQIGAAVGATGGGMQGMGARRRARLRR